MKNIAILLIFILLTLSGCMASHKIELIDTKTFSTISFKGDSNYVDELLPTSTMSDDVYHMARFDDGLKLFQRDIRGNVKNSTDIPLYSSFYGITPCALRADGRQMVYWRDEKSGLYQYNIEKEIEFLLLSKIAPNKCYVRGLFWMNDSQVIVIINGKREKLQSPTNKSIFETSSLGRVIKIDTKQRKIVGSIEIAHLMEGAMSPSGRFLAVTQSARGEGIKIIDLSSMVVIEEVRNTDPVSWVSNLAWSPDEVTLAYSTGYKDDLHRISIFKLNDGVSKAIVNLSPNHICYFVGFPRKDLLVYRSGDIDRLFPSTYMHFIHLPDGELLRTIKRQYNGTSYIVGNGAVIASEVGF